jgi:hypothetical protein
MSLKRNKNISSIQAPEAGFLVFGFVLFCFVVTESQKSQPGLELTIFLPQPPKCWGNRHVPPFPA